MTVEEMRHIVLDNRVDVDSLADVVRTLLRQGVPRSELEQELKALYGRLGDEGRETDQDAVADVVDSLIGWASPSALL